MTSIYKFLTDYKKKDIYPFHMPGHKRNPAFLPPDLISLDVTEFDGTDNLHAPEGVIKSLQEKISRIYGSEESFMLVNGSSSGIVAAMCAAFREDDEVFVDRGSHQSVFHGLALCGAAPVYKFSKNIENAVVTSPTYEGLVKDIEVYAERVHSNGGVLIVDEAHGAHFPFHCAFPENAQRLGADISINSFHKTLPGLSQTAALHVSGSRIDMDKLRFYLRVMQTSSPSYIFMAAADFMLDKLTLEPKHFEIYADELKRLRNELRSIAKREDCGHISFKSQYLRGVNGANTGPALASQENNRYVRAEIGKILFEVNSSVSGHEIMKTMAEKYRVQLEMATDETILAMTSVADTRDGFNRLINAVASINEDIAPFPMRGEIEKRDFTMFKPFVVLTPKEALRCETETVAVSASQGRIAAEFVTEYPPGIPLLVPGERITAEVLSLIKKEFIKAVKHSKQKPPGRKLPPL